MSILDGAYWEKEMYKKTNADRIRVTSDEELAQMFSDACPPNYGAINCRDHYLKNESGGGCYKCWLDWLKQEATE